MYKGIHLIGDLHQCNLESFALQESAVASIIGTIEAHIREAGLTVLGSVSHYFGPGAVTAAVILSESHVSFHTWPESDYVSLDVFVCNHETNNTDKGKVVYDYLCQLFKAGDIRTQAIDR